MHTQSKSCRLCKNTNMSMRFALAPTPPAEWYYTEEFKHLTNETYPLNVYQCEACGHVQLIDIIDPKVLYGNYFYTSQSSPGLCEYFKKYFTELTQFLNLPPRSIIADIGSNDGIFLQNFLYADFEVIGIEPSKTVAEIAKSKGINTINSFFDEHTVSEILEIHGEIDLITANNVFAHNDDLSGMLKCIHSVLKPSGYFVFEVSNLHDTIFNKVFDFIYHEHLSYHSVKPLKKFMTTHNMSLFHVERTQSKGGTLRCYCKPSTNSALVYSSVDKYIEFEEKSGLYSASTYDSYCNEVKLVGENFKNKLLKAKQEGKLIAGYGASATVTTLIYHFDISNLIDFLVDDNPIRHGTYSPGHHIKVLHPSEIKKQGVDVVAILAWRFEQQIRQKHSDLLAETDVIVPEL